MMFEDKDNTKKLWRFISILISLNEIIIDFQTFFQKNTRALKRQVLTPFGAFKEFCRLFQILDATFWLRSVFSKADLI